jgi:hypothetical protein
MAELKTKPTGEDVEKFLNGVSEERKRQDSFTILALMKQVTGLEPRMWGGSLIGFGEYHYKYASGHEGDTFLVGFSPRKQALTLYILSGFEQQAPLLAKLGKFKTGVGCLYIKSLEDVDLPTLRLGLPVRLVEAEAVPV